MTKIEMYTVIFIYFWKIWPDLNPAPTLGKKF